jgi:two-component system, OmpR family, sensor histidine kinase SenX3
VKRRLLPIALTGGLLLLALGLWQLAQIFTHERAQALAASDARHEALRQYAAAAITQRAQRHLQAAAAELADAQADPLRPDSHLLLIRDGQQLSPRPTAPRPGQDHPALDHLRSLRDADARPTADGPWGERLAIRAAFLDALRANDPAAQASAFRRLLSHRARYQLRIQQDLPLTLSLLEAFLAQGTPVHETLRHILHRGLTDRAGHQIEGLQAQLIRRRPALTEPDFRALADATLALSIAVKAPYVAFKAASHRSARLIQAPAEPRSAGWYGDWLITTDGPTLRGLRHPRSQLLTTLSQAMRASGLLTPAETVTLPTSATLPLTALRPHIQSPAWARAHRDAQQAWQLKRALLIFAGALAASLVALALAAHRRRQRALGLKSDFVSAVSHELRTPLASIRAMAETLERRLQGEARARDYPTRIVRDVDRMGLLVENILSFNRLDKGRWIARREPLRLQDLIDATQEAVADLEARPIRWHTQPCAHTLNADPTLMKLLLTNLARNACTYNDRDPIELHLTVHPEPDALTLRFTDNGRGITADALPHIFTAFYRAPHNQPARGSGLGLALCQRIMHLHGGRISVDTTGPEGTTFRLSFSKKGGTWAGS